MKEHIDLIEAIFVSCGYKDYLELGVWNGVNLARMAKHARHALGVDISDVREDKSTEFFLGTTDDFFAGVVGTFDLIFIDADHNYEQLKKDLANSLKVLNIKGTIIIHDTDPVRPELLAEGYCSDSYKIKQDLLRRGLNFVTLPMNDAGLTIVKYPDSERVVGFVPQETNV